MSSKNRNKKNNKKSGLTRAEMPDGASGLIQQNAKVIPTSSIKPASEISNDKVVPLEVIELTAEVSETPQKKLTSKEDSKNIGDATSPPTATNTTVHFHDIYKETDEEIDFYVPHDSDKTCESFLDQTILMDKIYQSSPAISPLRHSSEHDKINPSFGQSLNNSVESAGFPSPIRGANSNHTTPHKNPLSSIKSPVSLAGTPGISLETPAKSSVSSTEPPKTPKTPSYQHNEGGSSNTTETARSSQTASETTSESLEIKSVASTDRLNCLVSPDVGSNRGSEVADELETSLTWKDIDSMDESDGVTTERRTERKLQDIGRVSSSPAVAARRIDTADVVVSVSEAGVDCVGGSPSHLVVGEKIEKRENQTAVSNSNENQTGESTWKVFTDENETAESAMPEHYETLTVVEKAENVVRDVLSVTFNIPTTSTSTTGTSTTNKTRTATASNKSVSFVQRVVNFILSILTTVVNFYLWLLKLWFQAVLYVVYSPIRLLNAAADRVVKLVFRLAVWFLNSMPGGHKIPKATNGHVVKAY